MHYMKWIAYWIYCFFSAILHNFRLRQPILTYDTIGSDLTEK